jgi:membrane fusion protein, multidrug efflux system
MPADDMNFKVENHNTADVLELGPAATETIEAAPAKKKHSLKRKAALLTLAGVVAKVGVGFGVWWWMDGQYKVTTDNAYVGASTAQINSQTSGQILSVAVQDTQFVKKGDILATIDPADAQLVSAKATADYARTMQRVEQYYAQEAQAEAQVRAREADYSRASSDYARRRELATSGAISQEELSAARTNFEAAEANLSAAKKTLEAQRVLTRGWSVKDHPETEVARASLDTAALNLERTVIRSPIDGVVTQRKAQVGQRIDPGMPLMSIAPIADAYVDANFKEGQLAHVEIGQHVELKSDLYGDEVKFHGVVEGLGGGTGSAFAVIPAQNATGNWIKVVQRVPVRVALDPAELAKHPLRVGLSMEATIDTRKPKDETATAKAEQSKG